MPCALAEGGAGEAMVVAGGVIPVQDYELLHDAGVAAVFGPGTRIPAAGLAILNDLSAQLKGAHATMEKQAEVVKLRREVGESREMLGAIAEKLDELRRASDERVLNAYLMGASRATREDQDRDLARCKQLEPYVISSS